MSQSYKDPWHFPRGDLTEHVFSIYKTGVVRRLDLFAPRRRGKTWFLIRDLAPAAINRKIIPVYATLWESMNSPEKPILEGLEAARRSISGRGVQWKKYLQHIQSIGFAANSVNVNLRPAGGRATPAESDDLAAIGQLLRELVSKAPGGHVLFMLDEAQHLATDKRFLPLVAMLRSVLDSIEAAGSNNLRTLFTGSSRTNLDALVRDPKAPFYKSTERIELPDLGPDYTKYIVGQLRRLGRVNVTHDACERTFDKLDRSPYHMQQIIRELMLKRAATIEEAFEIMMNKIVNDPYNKARWGSLKPLDQLVYVGVCEGREIYSASARSDYSKALDRDINTALVQRSIDRLVKEGLVSVPGHGQYQNEDTEMLAWVKAQ